MNISQNLSASQRKHLMKKPGVNFFSEVVSVSYVRLKREINEYEIKYKRRDS